MNAICGSWLATEMCMRAIYICMYVCVCIKEKKKKKKERKSIRNKKSITKSWPNSIRTVVIYVRASCVASSTHSDCVRCIVCGLIVYHIESEREKRCVRNHIVAIFGWCARNCAEPLLEKNMEPIAPSKLYIWGHGVRASYGWNRTFYNYSSCTIAKIAATATTISACCRCCMCVCVWMAYAVGTTQRTIIIIHLNIIWCGIWM